ncbi:hypothetical protein Tco_0559806 [Tanacetum coccineum]
MNAKTSVNSGVESKGNNKIDALLLMLLERLDVPTGSHTNAPKSPTTSNAYPNVYYASASPSPFGYQPTIIGPSGQHGQPGQTNSGQQVSGQPASLGQLSGQETVLPHAFSTMTFQDHTTGAWNMDTGESSPLNSSVTSLNTVFNPFISVGDNHSIPIINTGHSILPTPTKSLHLNNVLNDPQFAII